MIHVRGDVPTSPPPDVSTLVKLTVSMPPDVAAALPRWALDDAELQARVTPTAQSITSARRARR